MPIAWKPSTANRFDLLLLNLQLALLYESSFTDVAPQGPDAIFTAEQVDRITRLLEDIRSTAVAA